MKISRLFIASLFASLFFAFNTVFAAVPSAITTLSSASEDGQVRLFWNAPSATPAISDYVISYREYGTSTWNTFSDGVSTATTAVVTNLSNRIRYEFKVSAVNADGTGAQSNLVNTIPLGLIFQDTFENYTTGSNIANQNGWTTGGDGTWTVQAGNGGKVVAPATAGTHFFRNNIQNGTPSYSSSRIVVDYKHGAASALPQLWLRKTAATGDAGGYLLYQDTGAKLFYIVKYTANSGGAFTAAVSAAAPIASLVNNTFYRVEFEAINTPTGAVELKGYLYPVNGAKTKPFISWTNTSSVYSSGYFGIGRFAGQAVAYDNLKVYDFSVFNTPSAPTALVATPSLNQISLSFTAPSSQGSSPITDYIIEYKQSSLSTWNTFSDNVSTATTAVVTNLSNATSYDFRVKAVNASGTGLSSSVVSSTTSSPNQAPNVNAGLDQTITLPSSSVTLGGSATDTDGSIVSYSWTKLSGGTADIASPTSASTVVSNLSQGNYVFRFTATDNGSLSSSDDVNVVVNAQGNISPTVDAGTDQTLTSPTSTTTLSSIATDTDGSIVSYLWSVLSGVGAIINSPTTASTDISNLSVGSYVFQITVTDDQGAIATDTISVSVVNQNTPPTASNVSVSGTAQVGQNLSGSYTYFDTDGDSEGVSTFRWLSSTNSSGPYVAISGATNLSYTVQTSDLGKYLKFEVTPVSTVSPTAGSLVESNAFGPILDIPSAPSAPQNLQSTPGDTQISLSFTAPSSQGSSPITDYIIEYKQSSLSTWNTFSDNVSTATTAVVTNLSNATSYDFRVKAVNSVGSSVYSNTVTSTPVGTTLFSENFESYTVGTNISGLNGWTPAVAGATWQIKSDGSKVVGPTTSVPFHQNIISNGNASLSNIKVSFDFKAFSDGTQFFPQIWLRRSALSGDAGGYLIYQGGNAFVIATHTANSGQTFTQQAYSSWTPVSGTVYRVEAEITNNASNQPVITLWAYPLGGTKGSPVVAWTDTSSLFNSGYFGFGFGTWASPISTLWIDNISVVSTATSSAPTYYHIFSTGQSLSTGYNSAPALTTTQPYENLMLTNGVEKSATPLIPLVESGTGENTNVETPSSALANTIRSLDSQARKIIMSLHGHNGATYSQIKKGTQYYSLGMTQETNAKNYVTGTLNANYKPSGVTLTHGESDYQFGTSPTTYIANLVEMQNDYQTDLNANAGTGGTIPLFINQMNTGLDGKIAAAQFTAHKNNTGKIVLVGPKYQLSYGPDNVHLTNQGSKYLGELMGKVIKKVIFDGQSWNPLMPTSITRSSNVITTSFAIPTGSLVLDTTNMALRPNYGFEFTQTGGNSVSITNVQLINNNTQVQITLSAVPTGINQRLRYAYTCTGNHTGTWPFQCGKANDGTYVGGNLRDSDTSVSSAPNSTGLPLYNWLVAFDEPIQ